MPEFKLVYFNFRGRAELPRLMFAAAGVKYEDCRIEMADWPKEKEKTPFGQVPVLMIDGKPLPQTGAIIRYLAKELKLDGENALMSAYTDMIRETVSGVLENMKPLFEKDEETKKKLMAECFEKQVFPTFAKMEKKFAGEKKDYLIGQKLTYADLAMMDAMSTLEGMHPGFNKKHPALHGLCKRVQEQKGVAAWLKKRPVTDF